MPSSAQSFGGPIKSLEGYVKAASQAGLTCEVLGPSSSRDDEGELMRALGTARLHIQPGYGEGAFALSPLVHRWLQTHVREYDVVHVHGLLNAISSLSARLARERRVPLVIRPFGTLSRFTIAHRRSTLKRAYLRMVDLPNLRGSQALHFTTQEECEEAGHFGMEFGPLSHVVPPPVIVKQEPRRREVRSLQNVLFLSRLHPKKNIEGLLSAWARVVQRAPRARLVIAGSGDPRFRSALERRVVELGIVSSVQFAGFVEGKIKADLLEAADVFVLPSFNENFGIAVLEALGAGLPVVISRAVQLSSFVEQQRVGLVTGTDPESIATALVTLACDPSCLRDFAGRSRAAVEKQFSLVTVGSALTDMYEMAVRRSATSGSERRAR
jgi:glycosyltransferase involved in cell wall biosynthesis